MRFGHVWDGQRFFLRVQKVIELKDWEKVAQLKEEKEKIVRIYILT
jgi:hypothetical protein